MRAFVCVRAFVLSFEGSRCICVHECVLVCVCVCQGEQVCLCGVLTRPHNGHIWTEQETNEKQAHAHTKHTQAMCLFVCAYRIHAHSCTHLIQKSPHSAFGFVHTLFACVCV